MGRVKDGVKETLQVSAETSRMNERQILLLSFIVTDIYTEF